MRSIAALKYIYENFERQALQHIPSPNSEINTNWLEQGVDGV
jgi:hypothetical protein